MSAIYTTPVLVWSVTETPSHQFLPEHQQLLWFGQGRVVVVSEQGWYLLKIASQEMSKIYSFNEIPSNLRAGEAIGDTDLVPSEENLHVINKFLRTSEKTEDTDTDTVKMTSSEIEMSPASSLFTGADLVGQAGTIWSLSFFATSFARLKDRPSAGYFKNEDHSLDIVPRAWTLWIKDEMAALFITDEKPTVVYWEEEKAWYVLVQRWDCGLDVFRIELKQ